MNVNQAYAPPKRTSAGSSILLAGMVLAILSGCANLPEQGSVQAEWARNLRELGIVPVFPPREDVFVGDVYLSALNVDSVEADSILRARWSTLTPQEQQFRSEIGMWTRWYSIDVSDAAEYEYSKRPAMPTSGDSLSNQSTANGSDFGRIVSQPTIGAKSLYRIDRTNTDWDRVNRARLVAFPDFSATAYNQADMKALIPIEAFGLGLAGSYDNLKSVTLKIPMAESYAVSVQAVLSQLAPVLATTKENEQLIASQITSATVQEYHRLLQRIADELPTNKVYGVLIPQLVDACKTSLDRFQWRRELDPALNDTDDFPPFVAWGNLLIATARNSPYKMDNSDADWLNFIRRFDYALEPTFAYRRKLGRIAAQGPIVLKGLDVSRFSAFAKNDQGPPQAHLRVITEVFYARAIDVSIAAKRSLGFQAAVSPLLSSNISIGDGTSSITSNGSTNKVEEASLLLQRSTESFLSERVSALQSRLSAASSLPGGTSLVVSATDQTLGMRRLFDRPVAIGVRAVKLTVDVNTGFVISGSPSGGAAPVFANSSD